MRGVGQQKTPKKTPRRNVNRVLSNKKPQTPEYKRILRRIKEKKMNMKQKTPKTDEKGDIKTRGGALGAESDECAMKIEAPDKKVLYGNSSQSDINVEEMKGGPLLTLSSRKFKNSNSQKIRGKKARIVVDPTQPKLTRFWGPKSD